MSGSARRFKPPMRSSAKRAGILEAVKLPSQFAALRTESARVLRAEDPSPQVQRKNKTRGHQTQRLHSLVWCPASPHSRQTTSECGTETGDTFGRWLGGRYRADDISPAVFAKRLSKTIPAMRIK